MKKNIKKHVALFVVLILILGIGLYGLRQINIKRAEDLLLEIFNSSLENDGVPLGRGHLKKIQPNEIILNKDSDSEQMVLLYQKFPENAESTEVAVVMYDANIPFIGNPSIIKKYTSSIIGMSFDEVVKLSHKRGFIKPLNAESVIRTYKESKGDNWDKLYTSKSPYEIVITENKGENLAKVSFVSHTDSAEKREESGEEGAMIVEVFQLTRDHIFDPTWDVEELSSSTVWMSFEEVVKLAKTKDIGIMNRKLMNYNIGNDCFKSKEHPGKWDCGSRYLDHGDNHNIIDNKVEPEPVQHLQLNSEDILKSYNLPDNVREEFEGWNGRVGVILKDNIIYEDTEHSGELIRDYSLGNSLLRLQIDATAYPTDSLCDGHLTYSSDNTNIQKELYTNEDGSVVCVLKDTVKGSWNFRVRRRNSFYGADYFQEDQDIEATVYVLTVDELGENPEVVVFDGNKILSDGWIKV